MRDEDQGLVRMSIQNDIVAVKHALSFCLKMMTFLINLSVIVSILDLY